MTEPKRYVDRQRRLDRKLRWDPEKEHFPDDAEADGMLSRPMRSPWKLAQAGSHG
ncbi:MAG: hypothetical protein ACOX1P_20425 [Thermoguttaceae bacterium]